MERSLITARSAVDVLITQEVCGHIKKLTLGKSLSSANTVVGVLAK